MSKHGSLLRRIALAIIGYAMRVVPPDRSSWARGMRQEIDYIDSDRSALGWAVGCLFAACRERVRAIDPLRTPLARSVLALMIGFEAFQALFAPMMVFSYRLGDIGVTRTLGGLTPGDDYRRFIPLMDTANELPLSLWSVSGILFIAAAWQLVRTRWAAFGLFALAYVLSLIGSGVGTLIPDYSDASRRAFTFAQPNFRRDVLIPVASALLTIVVGTVLWWSSSPRVPPSHEANSDEAG
jgi:hypothetical protein